MPDHHMPHLEDTLARLEQLTGTGRQRRAESRPEILSIDDILAAPDRDYLLKGVISPGEMSVWYGAPKCGKSFLVMHLAYALAQGRSVFGKRVKPVRVLYIAAEGRSGLKGRMKALRKRFGPAFEFVFIVQPLDLRSKDVADWLAAEVKARGIGLVVVDTLSRNLAGGDENAPGDMTAFIGSLDMIRTETGAHVAVIHHCPQHADRPRGHGSLIGAADALIAVVKNEDGTRTATVTGAKDDPADQVMAFRFQVVELGEDADGDPMTTLTVDELEPGSVPTPARKAAKPAAARDIALDLLERAIIDEGTPAPASRNIPPGVLTVPIETWRAYCYAGQTTGTDNPDARRKAFARACRDLQGQKRIGVWKSLVWLANSAKPDNDRTCPAGTGENRAEKHPDNVPDNAPDRAKTDCPDGWQAFDNAAENGQTGQQPDMSGSCPGACPPDNRTGHHASLEAVSLSGWTGSRGSDVCPEGDDRG